MTASTKSIVNTKLNINAEDREHDGVKRFCLLYNDRSSGKKALLEELLAGGTILKESGLIDIVLNLDKNPEFRNAPNSTKSRMLLVELGELFASAVEQPVTASAKQVAAEEPAPPKQPEAPSQPVQPARRVAPVRAKRPTPSLGVSGVKPNK